MYTRQDSTNIDAYCTGYYVRFEDSISQRIWPRAHLSDDTDIWGFVVGGVEVSSTEYCLGYDSAKIISLVENTPVRVRVIVSGNLKTSGGSALTNSTSCESYFSIYQDKVVVHTKWVTSGSITIDNDIDNRFFCTVLAPAQITGEAAFYENAGSESSATDYTEYNSADYFLITSTEINAQTIPAYWSPTAGYSQYNADSYVHRIRWKGTTIPAGTHYMTAVVLLDTASTYSAANRATLGDQFHDLPNDPTFPDITESKGAIITDLHDPDMLVSNEPIGSDGAYQIELDSVLNNAMITFKQDEINPAIVLIEPGASIRSGTVASSTEHVDSYWDCDSTTLNLGTGSVTVTNATYAAGKRGNGVQIDANAETAYYPSSGNITSAQGAINFYIKITTPAANCRCFQHSAVANRFELYIVSATSVIANINGTSVTFTVDLNTLDSQFHNIWFCWDTADNIQWLIIDGKTFISYTVITEPDLSSGNIYIGNGSGGVNPINGIIDEWRVYDQPIVQGSFVPSNLDAYSDAHSDISLYSDDGSTMRIGTTNLQNIANIANDEGSVSFQVDPSSALTGDETLFSAGSSFHIAWDHSDSDIVFTYGSSTVRTTTSLPAGLAGKHHIKATWKDTSAELIELEVDGVRYTATSTTAPTLGAAVAWSSSVGMTENTITSSQNTPQLLTAYGAPIQAPQVTEG